MSKRLSLPVIPPRDTAPAFADFLNWGSLIADGVVLGKDGSLIAGWRVTGPDSLALADHDRNALSDRMNTALLGLGAGWAMWYDVSRMRVADYPAADRSAFPDRVSQLVDDERHRQFSGGLDLFESVHTLVLQFVPSRDQVRRLESLLYTTAGGTEGRAARLLADFEKAMAGIENKLDGLLDLHRLRSYGVPDGFGRIDTCCELVDYLDFTIFGEPRRIRIPPDASALVVGSAAITYTVTTTLMIGLFVWFIDNSQWIAMSVIDSFRQAGADVSGLSSLIHPSDMLDNGISLYRAIKSHLSIFNPDESMGILFMAIAILACFAWMAVLYILALVEMYLVVATIPLFVAWGGVSWTRGVALNALRYPVAAGAKLLTLMLIAGVLNRLATDWVTAFETTGVGNVDVLFGFGLVAAALTHSIPGLVAGMINGSASTAGHGLMTAVSNFRTGTSMAAGAVGKGLSTAVGGGVAVAAASGLAMARQGDSASDMSALAKIGATGKTLTGGVAGAAGDKLSGRMSPRASTLWGAAANMRDTTRHVRAESSKPKPSPEDVANKID